MEKAKVWERWKDMADIFLKQDSKVYIRDINDNFYFSKILLVGESTLRIECFAPKKREGEKITLYYPEILQLEKYKEEM